MSVPLLSAAGEVCLIVAMALSSLSQFVRLRLVTDGL